MFKKIITVTAVVVAVSLVGIGGKNIANAAIGNSESGSVSVNTENTKVNDEITSIEFSVVDDAYKCTKAEVDKFLAEIEPDFSDKIERIWVNGWQGEAGVQGSTVDDEVIYRTIGGRDRNAYITNTFEDILDMWEAGEKVVLVGQNLVTDETTYQIGGEEYRIVGIFGEGPMEDHMALPLAAYPELDTINAVCIMFNEPLSDAQMELLNNAVQDAFGGKISIK